MLKIQPTDQPLIDTVDGWWSECDQPTKQETNTNSQTDWVTKYLTNQPTNQTGNKHKFTNWLSDQVSN